MHILPAEIAKGMKICRNLNKQFRAFNISDQGNRVVNSLASRMIALCGE